MKKTTILMLITIALSFVIAFYYYPQMPERVASHWDINGDVNGYMGKFWGVFLMPIISLAMLLLFLIIPLIDPLKANIKKFRKYYDSFIVIILLFFFYIYILTIIWNLGTKFDMTKFLMPAFSILFFYCGILIEKSKRNWFIGIRTPWTLSSDEVWRKTHKLGGKLFKSFAILSLLAIFIPNYALIIILIPVLGISLYLIIYSYIEFKKENELKKSVKN